MNYFVHKNMVYDLENNVPYSTTPVITDQVKTGYQFNQKLMFSDGGRL